MIISTFRLGNFGLVLREVLEDKRIGIGKPQEEVPYEKYVLSKWTPEEEIALPYLEKMVTQCLENWLKEGAEGTMAKFNGTRSPYRLDY